MLVFPITTACKGLRRVSGNLRRIVRYGINWKRLVSNRYALGAALIIALAALLRIYLVGQSWPGTNIDESAMGFMATHIAYRGEHPIFFYGQYYMGAFEAYLAAPLYYLFGPTLFSLRLAVIIIFLLYLATTYAMTSLLYSKQLALAVLVLLSLGSWWMLLRELEAIGGYQDILLFGTLSFLLASWLALTRGESRWSGRWRLAAYAAWGLVVGLGLWSDLLILPFVVGSGLILLVFCWREWRSWAPLCLALGLLAGAFPLIYYNLHALPGQDSLSVLSRLRQADLLTAPPSHLTLFYRVREAFFISLPIMIGASPACNGADVRFSYLFHHQTFACSANYLSWAFGFALLWLCAACLALVGMWRVWREARATGLKPWPDESRRAFARHFAHLMLLGSGALAFLLYALSTAPTLYAVTNSRYLFGLLIITPAILSPLWSGVGVLSRQRSLLAKVMVVCRGAVLLLIGTALLLGTLATFRLIPQAQAVNQQRETLIQDLLHHGITRAYMDFGICFDLVFQSNEQFICSPIQANLKPSDDRYPAYDTMVKADPRAAYVLQAGSLEAHNFVLKMASEHAQYQHFLLDGYDVYMPV